ncbi:MAG: hypothetical protein AAF573_01285 [Bacteroidota bacterium]
MGLFLLHYIFSNQPNKYEKCKTIIFCLLFIASTLHGQTSPDYIQPRGGVYFYKGKKVKKKHLGRILKEDQEAFEFYRAYRRDKKINNTISSIGGLVLIGTGGLWLKSISEGKGYLGIEKLGILPILAIVGGFSGLIIAFSSSDSGYSEKLKTSVKLYNRNLQDKSQLGFKSSSYLDFGLTSAGVGFTFTFN